MSIDNNLRISVKCDINEAEELIRKALANHGFGVLTEIDVSKTLKAKIGVDRPALKILGACKPDFAHQALEIDPEVALMLPCNVVLDDIGNGNTRIRVVDPRGLLTDSRLDELANQAALHLQGALDEVVSELAKL